MQGETRCFQSVKLEHKREKPSETSGRSLSPADVQSGVRAVAPVHRESHLVAKQECTKLFGRANGIHPCTSSD